LVFTDPEALQQLELIIHPLVEQAVDLMIRRARQRVIVIEAIKLLEGKLVKGCDTVWTTYAPESLQKTRLMAKRGMTEQDALQRIHAQPSQEEKTAAANVVIQNVGSFENTWKQVVAAWKKISPASDTRPVVMRKADDGGISVQRGRPRDSVDIAVLINRLSDGAHKQSQEDIMAAFGEKAFLLLKADKKLVGLIGWQVENLVARITDLFVDSGIPAEKALTVLASEVERASQDLQCEACLVFLPAHATSQESIWQKLGYSRRTLQTLGVQAWRDAAIESQPPNTFLLFKQLRQDRILRPI
jgi:dephospho-CoA kinase